MSLLSLMWVASVQAQGKGGRWSEPYRLSSDAGTASEGYLVADPSGWVHAFWTETLFESQRTVIQYARFDGATWSTPNDIYLTNTTVNGVSPVVDRDGTLHIAWSVGLSGPAYYTYAPATDALSAKNWARPLQIDIPANTLKLRIDARGTLHLLYINRMEESGVYYVRSEDEGQTWSPPIWLDPDILPDHIPDSLSFELDDAGGLHAVWFYGGITQDARPDWVRYTHSLDGGLTWSIPFTIDQYSPEGDHNLRAASPVMIVQGQTVHVVWAAGPQPYRHHRFSSDAGQTWTTARRFFGELQGQAFDGLAVDQLGRVHFFGQLRYPLGIYHAYWVETQWTPPELLYLIAKEDFIEGVSDRVHVHFTRPVVRAGEQLVLTFTDPPADPNRRLFAMHHILDDPSSLAIAQTLVPNVTLVSAPSATPGAPTPMPTATAALFDTAQPVGQFPRLDLVLWVALVPTLLLLGGSIVVRLLYKRRP